MIQLYYDATPNGRKILIALEEIGCPYNLNWIQIDAGEQFSDEFKHISPSSKIPAITDSEGPNEMPISIFESGAILLYLATKYNILLPNNRRLKQGAINWLFWQTSTFGPTVGQATHYVSYASQRKDVDTTYGEIRYSLAAKELYKVLDTHLAKHRFLADEFSIADIAVYPWVRVAKGHGIDMVNYSNITDWAHRISLRPSTKVKPVRADETAPFKTFDAGDDQVWQALFNGAKQTPN